jgi:hypothetical protein
MLIMSTSAITQIYPPEGLNMPGGYNGWNIPPTINALAGIQKIGGILLVDTSLSTRRYKTQIYVNSTGADIIGGTYSWKFSSGPTSNYWANSWGGVSVSMNTLQNYTKEGSDNAVTVANGKYYSVVYKDNGYSNTDAIWMETSSQPVTISTVTQSPLPGSVTSSTSVAVTVIINTSKSAEENIYVRYTIDNWSTSTLVAVSFIGTSGTATIPSQIGGTAVKYYVFSTTLSNPTANFDLVTINHNNNNGLNYSYTVTAPTYTIDASAGAHGSINPSGAVIIGDGDDTTFTITSAPGYYIDSLIVDGIGIDTASSYTFLNVTMNHSIRVVFTKNVNITFQVNMKLMMRNGDFLIGSGDRVTIRGDMNNWGNPPSHPDTLTDPNIDSIYTKTISVKEDKIYGYKFWKTFRNGLDYESSTNRSISVATNDSTISVVYFNNSDVNVTFSVDMKVQMRKGNFLPESGDVVGVPGTHNGWQTGTYLSDPNYDSVYTKTFAVESNRSHEYKFWKTFRAGMDWESASNRPYVLDGNDTTLPTVYFNNEMLSINVTFQVDMSVQKIKGKFNPSTDVVLIRGSLNGWGTPDTLIDPNHDDVYSKTISIPGNQTIEYKFWKTDADNDKGYENIIVNRSFDLAVNDITIDAVYFSNDGSFKSDVPVSVGWNMISLPRIVTDSLVTSLFPGATSDAFKYDGIYTNIDTMENGVGYWLKYAKDTTFSIVGNNISLDTIDLKSGWNLIGTITDTILVSSVTTVPTSGILSSEFFAYNGSYTPEDTFMIPGKAYWIKSNGGKLVLQKQSSIQKTLLNRNLENLNQLVFKDNRGISQKLYLAMPSDNVSIEKYEMPPAPPLGGFDIRFKSNRFMELIEKNQPKEFPIIINATCYPLTIEWKMNSTSSWLVLTASGKDIPIKGNGSIRITDPMAKISLKSLASAELPKAYALEQNYPNPFNPTTSIKYALPVDALVELKIYDELGQEVATLVNEVQNAGYKTVEWNSTTQNRISAATGVYFYTIKATSMNDANQSFAQTEKMILLK